MKKSVSRFATLLILCSFLATLPKINMVEASETIYIRSDGSISPDTAPIQKNGNIYTLTRNIYNEFMVVERDYTIIDGNGHTLWGGGDLRLGAPGVALKTVTNVTIKNMVIQSFGRGIDFDISSNITISGNTIERSGTGILIFCGDSNTIVGNKIAMNEIGIIICRASNTILYHNNIVNNNIDLSPYEVPWGGSGVGVWDNGFEGNYWSRYTGVDNNSDGIGDTSHIINERNQDNYPLMYPWGPPHIHIVSPHLGNYTVADVPLTFTVDKPTSWICYSLDGQANVTISGNTTLTGLSDGTHNLTVYATDIFGNIGSSFRGDFTINAPPSISIVSPKNKTYTTPNIPLNFTVNEPASWIGYRLDRQTNVTITGNTTLTELSHGSHNLTVYANDTYGNTGTSETIHFSIAQQSEPFPTAWVVATIVIVAVVGVSFLVYFTKIRKTTGEAEKMAEGVM